ncbi:hypothetical protein EFK50_01030 [Nocardioides marmoriginsengisoli]|uniref:Uncharacterized protein n=1 Tax=Nocardioides marmoriginsengisoli TaxID=661483 RepID=A0A3N0CS64_9ACTN|nr:hypothetical protein [Nocardioides marmoriginsengisoli]RNL66240.1 hypothetical protein EFK50_01030 [Nocardioides marmoriginsengisoli]
MGAIKPRTTTVILFQGDDLDPMTEKAQAVEKAVKSAAPARVGDAEDPNLTKSTTSFDEFMDEATERAEKVTLTALARKAYRVLLNAHPPRMVENEDGPPTPHPEDAAKGFNRETFGDDLVPVSMHLGRIGDDDEARKVILDQVVERTYVPPTDIVELTDSVSDGDFSKLYAAAVNLNQSPGPDPKVRLSSHLAPTSDETSTSPARLA